MCRHAGFRWGGAGRRELIRGWGARGTGGCGGRLSGSCGLCRVFSLSVSLLFLFPLFAVLLNYPYPDPPISACFFPFSSAPRWGEGQPRGAFVACCSRNQNTKHWMELVFVLFVQGIHLSAPSVAWGLVQTIQRSKNALAPVFL